MKPTHSLLLASLLSAFLSALAAPGALAADATKPHAHQGVLKPYPRPPPPVKLSDAERKLLDEGKPVMRQAEGAAGGRGMAVFKVNASPDVTWGVIQEFGSYPQWIDELEKCDVYRREGGKIDVAFQIKTFAITVDYFIHHEFDIAGRWGTWTLDYSRQSDLDDSVGFWRITPVEGNPGQSLVEYSVDIQVSGWVPNFVRELLVDKGLKQSTSWVTVQSEKRARAR